MFISFEGIDGSGKSTQAAVLVDALRRGGRNVRYVREPGGTELGERVRSLLLEGGSVAPMAELLLFSAARAQLVADVVRPALQAGEIVVADRFFDSTTAYQGGGRGLADVDWLDAFHARVTDGVAPEVTFLLDVPVEEAMSRRGNRADDRMERGGEAFFRRVREAYIELAHRHPDRIILLDATAPRDAVSARILAAATERLGTAEL